MDRVTNRAPVDRLSVTLSAVNQTELPISSVRPHLASLSLVTGVHRVCGVPGQPLETGVCSSSHRDRQAQRPSSAPAMSFRSLISTGPKATWLMFFSQESPGAAVDIRPAASRIVSEPIVSLIHCPTLCTYHVQKCRETYVGYATPRYESSGVCQLQMPRDGAALGDFRAIHTCKTLGDQSDHGGFSSNCLHPRIVGCWEGKGELTVDYEPTAGPVSFAGMVSCLKGADKTIFAFGLPLPSIEPHYHSLCVSSSRLNLVWNTSNGEVQLYNVWAHASV
ncbi:uncharacterized protein CLUP02_07786 [Colletotrichum lupini]|uniref:Uncharacterized protein n=1 Tax=Colletotrichum lupini TaxID=145971 RepID=A0A9Q8WGA4_9PEZI|nr:uncharacterized protein CLUP02_07786 [Colletotrichum lupini]UQC82299.1 hypothetical protein CLUP02_07786 [Colletotrichum lupini]